MESTQQRVKINKVLRRQVWEKHFGEAGIGICPACGIAKLSAFDFDVGHVVPLSKGGPTVLSNLVVVCRLCNSSNGNKEMDGKQLHKNAMSEKGVCVHGRSVKTCGFRWKGSLPRIVDLAQMRQTLIQCFSQSLQNVDFVIKGTKRVLCNGDQLQDDEVMIEAQKKQPHKKMKVVHPDDAKRKFTLSCQQGKEFENSNQEFIEYILSLDDYKGIKKLDPAFLRCFFQATQSNSEEIFRILLTDVAKLLHSNEGNVRRLLNTMQLGIDYKVVVIPTAERGRPKEHVYLTVDCFLRVCLRSKSPHGEQVRSYFIIMEQTYRDFAQGKSAHRILLKTTNENVQ